MTAGPRRGALTFILIAVGLDVLSLGITLPSLPRLIAELTRGGAHDAAVMFGIYMSTWHGAHLVAAPVLGELSDRYGRRPVILVSSLGLSLDYVLMALAPTLTLLFVGRVIAGITSATISVAGAYVVDVVPKEKRAASFGALGAAYAVGFVFGPALGGVLGDVSPRLPFWVAGGLSLVNTAYGYFVLPESLPADKRRPLSWQSANPFRSFSVLGATRVQLRNTFVLFFTVASQQVFQSTFVLYAMARYGWSVKSVGMAMALYGVAGGLVQAFGTKRLVAWLGERSGVRVGLFCGVLAFFTIGATASPLVCLVAISFAAMGAGLTRPSLNSLMTKEVSERRQGQLSGAITCLMGIAGIIAPAIFTRVFAWGNEAERLPGAPFVLASGLLLVALAMTALVNRLSAGDAGHSG